MSRPGISSAPLPVSVSRGVVEGVGNAPKCAREASHVARWARALPQQFDLSLHQIPDVPVERLFIEWVGADVDVVALPDSRVVDQR